MTVTRKCYQCGDSDLPAIREKRNEEIRAYGRKVLADADAALLSETPGANDWSVLDEEDEIDVEEAAVVAEKKAPVKPKK